VEFIETNVYKATICQHFPGRNWGIKRTAWKGSRPRRLILPASLRQTNKRGAITVGVSRTLERTWHVQQVNNNHGVFRSINPCSRIKKKTQLRSNFPSFTYFNTRINSTNLHKHTQRINCDVYSLYIQGYWRKIPSPTQTSLHGAGDAISRSAWSYAASVSSQLPDRTVERATLVHTPLVRRPRPRSIPFFFRSTSSIHKTATKISCLITTKTKWKVVKIVQWLYVLQLLNEQRLTQCRTCGRSGEQTITDQHTSLVEVSMVFGSL
jgi:hypothetical protein